MSRSVCRVTRAEAADLDALAPLFDAYRQFYERPADLTRSRTFLAERLAQQQSVLWLAWQGDQAVGLCQCYPSFCSVLAAPIWVLYDLYVSAEARRSGAGRALMQAAEAAARAQGIARLDLTTAHDNLRAQALYVSQGWVHDQVFRTYTKTLGPQT
ncbi:GNAT family N-acetyltransferase [Hydrogenophaga sp. RWCD_12]|uniref:GNAT family N-acetyltransferase n=1 Tax=Hydrogenophaga sp. RWCD_12 TaxID=3391190 RepID=UPI003984E2E2